jgi:putative copper export protein
MDYLDLLMRVLHIFGATMLVGAMLFMLMAVVPALGRLADERRREMFAALRPRWAMLVGVGAALLLVSGLYNAARISILYDFSGTHYQALLAVKILLALIVFLLAALVSGRSSLAVRLQQKLATWLIITLTLMVATMAVAAYMKSVAHVPKQPDAANSRQAV